MRKRIVEIFPDGILVLDGQDRIQDINCTAISFLGIQNHRIIGLPIESAGIRDARLLNAIVHPDSVEQIEIRSCDEVKVFSINKQQIQDYPDCRIVLIKNISGYVARHNEILALLEHYRSRFATISPIVDSMPEILTSRDRDIKYIFANKAVCENLLQGKKSEGYDTFFEESKQRDLADGIGVASDDALTLQFLYERIAALETLRLSEQNLHLINAEKDRFYSIIAHDLRSPFYGFLGLTQILEEELDNLTTEEVKDIALKIKRSAKNLFRLLENLLEWSKNQQGLIPFNPTEINLLPSLIESIAIIMEFAISKGIQLTYDIPGDLVVIADCNMFQTVVRNLVSNAVKFTPVGGSVTVSAKVADNTTTEISIKDSGIGMSQAIIEGLFRLDVNTNRSGTEGETSTGLGLIICKDFIGKHGEKIWVESEVGKGTEFLFTLPLKQKM